MKIQLFGTKIYISFLFSATIALMLATDRTGLVIPTFFAVLIHETGHLLAMWAAGCAPKEIRLIPASVQIIEGFPVSDKRSAAIILAGPFGNLAVFASLFINYNLGVEISLKFALLNAVLAVFNMLPVSGLDGGRLLVLLLSRHKDLYFAERVVRLITVAFSVLTLVSGVTLLFYGRANISVFIVALYFAVWVAMKK